MRGIASRLRKKLLPDDKNEKCGLVLKRDRIIEVPNAHPHPEMGFLISATALHENRDVLKGTWHTHPGMTAAISQDDYQGFSNWPGLIHYIVGTDGVRAYRADAEGVVEEVPCS